VKKNTLLTTIFIVSLLFSALAGTHLVSLATANPYLYHKEISPPVDMKPPAISITPSINNTVHASNNIYLTLTVSIPKYKSTFFKYYLSLNRIQYQGDWSDNLVNIYSWGGSGPLITDFSDNLTLTDIPEGSHNVTFTAYVDGGRADGLTWSYFGLQNHLTLNFTVDITAPTISISSIENRTYETCDIPLNFTVNESATRVSYSLDGLDNVTVVGNTTLASLSIGEHNVTVFATDKAGNTGASETVLFTIPEPPEPFPTTVVIASVVTVTVIGLGLLVYFKKRKH
jgi:hypothetical protein